MFHYSAKMFDVLAPGGGGGTPHVGGGGWPVEICFFNPKKAKLGGGEEQVSVYRYSQRQNNKTAHSALTFVLQSEFQIVAQPVGGDAVAPRLRILCLQDARVGDDVLLLRRGYRPRDSRHGEIAEFLHNTPSCEVISLLDLQVLLVPGGGGVHKGN